MNETTQYLITAAVIDLARSAARRANLKLPDDAPITARKSVEDFIPHALDDFLAFHRTVQTLLAARPPA